MASRHEHLPPLQCLRAFLAVAEIGNFTRAAEVLGLTQTAVSHQIAQLETHVGTPLFLRKRPGVELTAAGRGLLPSVESALDELRTAIARTRPGRRGGEITVSTTPEFGTRWLTPRLERLFRDDPDLRVKLGLEYRRADVAGGEVDLAIWLGTGGRGLKALPLGLEEEFVVCSKELSAKLPKYQAFRAAPALRYAGARHTLLDWERWYDLVRGDERSPEFSEFQLGPVHDTFDDMLEACRRGEGFALVRSTLVADDLAEGRLIRAVVESVTSDLQYHVVLPDGALRPEVARFVEWLRATAAAEGLRPG